MLSTLAKQKLICTGIWKGVFLQKFLPGRDSDGD